jgi:hypothetical protein
MKDVVRNSLFPMADMVISMSREFGVPITQEDFDGMHIVKVVEDGRIYKLIMQPH